MPRRQLITALCLLPGLAAVGCVQPEPNAEPLPPHILSKEIFEPTGEWWFQRTVIDAPQNISYTYVGDGDYPDRVSWRIEENYLIAYRSQRIVRGADASTSGVNDYEAPAAIYPITRHLDVVQGQPLEVPKRPWFERAYFEVDWGNEQTGTYRFSLTRATQLSREQPSWWVQRPDDPDFPIFQTDYVDFTTHVTVSATESDDPEEQDNGLCERPLDSYVVDVLDCTPANIAYRTSAMRIPDDHDYEPVVVPESTEGLAYNWFIRMFRMGNVIIDDEYSITDNGVQLKLSRLNLWKRSYDDDGDRIPLNDREFAPVAFHVSDNFPSEYVGALEDAAAEWDRELRDTVREARTFECVDAGGAEDACREQAGDAPPLFVICPNNPVQEGDPAACAPVGTHIRFSDIRYHMVNWNEHPSANRFLGIGWWAPDPATGEIVHGRVNVWPSDIIRSSAFTRDAILMAQGRLDPDDVLRGRHLDQWLADVEAYNTNPYAVMTTATLPVDDDVDGPRLPTSDTTTVRPQPSDERTLSPLYLRDPITREQALAPLLDTPYEMQTIDWESLLLAGFDPSEPGLGTGDLVTASPLRRSARAYAALRNELRKRLEPIGGDLDLPTDIEIAPLAAEMADNSPEEILAVVQDRYTRWVFVHELGHVLGLQHNYAASYDPLNYRSEYWDMRDDGSMGPRWTDPMTRAEREGGLETFAYSSVMDYLPSPASSPTTLGPYDRAAIHYSYGNLVEVFDDPGDAGRNFLRYEWFRSPLVGVTVIPVEDAAAPGGHRHTGLHYTKLPATLGDLQARSWVPLDRITDFYSWGRAVTDDTGRVVVPYIFCGGESVAYRTWCKQYDRGADAYEIMANTLNWFRVYYPLNSFRRGRATFTQNQYLSTVWFRIFDPMRNAIGHYAHYRTEFEDAAFSDPDLLQPVQKSVDAAFQFMAELLVTPEPGDLYLVPQPDGADVLVPANRYGAQRNPYTSGLFHSLVEPEPDEADIVAEVPIGIGRFYRSEVLTTHGAVTVNNVGSALDKELALEALLDPEFWWFNGRDSWPDARLWAVNFSSAYSEQLTDLLGSIVAGDHRQIAPTWDGTRFQVRDFLDPTSTVTGTPISPALGFNLRLRTLVFGLGLHFGGDLDRTFLEQSRIVAVGTGEDYATARVPVEFVNPFTGMTYRAYRFDEGGRELGIGARMLDRAQVLFDASIGLGGESAEDMDHAAQMLRNQVDLIDVTRAVTKIYADQPFDPGTVAGAPREDPTGETEEEGDDG